ncbi:MAG: LysR family transcriptional regulator [Methyloprofundus sp.]|nr:LysR family transcriptional regulator [Methyloprofundus sp.]
MIDLKRLHHAHTLARYQNFALAAEALSLSQSALTRSIQSLEKQLGVLLFERTRKGTKPTAFGIKLLEHNEVIAQQLRQLERDMQDMQGMRTGTLNVGAGPAVAKSFLGAATGKFNQQHPHIDINLKLETINQLYAQLLAGKIEFIVGDPLYINPDQQIDIRAFPRHPIYFFCRQHHPILQSNEINLQAIFQYPFAAPYMARHYKLALMKRFALNNVRTERFSSCSDIECDNLDILESIVENSDAISFTTKSIQHRFPESLTLIPLEIPDLQTNYAIITLPNKLLSPHAEAYIEQLFMSEMDY